MDASFWHNRWQNGEIGFHRETPHPSLPAHWVRVGVAAGERVFVPLCGKSLDMVWLAERGHGVVGVELSELAVDQFFAERGVAPDIRVTEGFTVKTAGPFEIWCCDLFAMPGAALTDVAAVYDRASLVALPPETQECYVAWLGRMVPEAPVLVVSLAYDETEMSGPPFSIPKARVRRLFEDSGYALDEIESTDAMAENDGLRKRGLTSLEETVHIARRRS